MTRYLSLFTLLIAMFGAAVAGGSEQATRLYSRGLVEFHAGRYSKALELFEQAVEADAADPYALYYRGVTRGRLGNYADAITDLRLVVARKPEFAQANLELGVALVHGDQYRDALPWLRQAQRVAETEAKASLVLAIAQLQLGQLAAAQQNLERAVRNPDLRNTARYYQGVVAYRQEQWEAAAEHFAYVAGTSADSTIGREAAAFLAKLRRGAPRTYQLFGSLGFQYDSNVVLAPSQDVIKTAEGISKQADGRVTLDAGGTYVPWHTERVQLSLGYEFFQSLHFDLTDFNIQDHRPTGQVAVDAGPVQLGLLGRYDYYFLGTDSFLQEVSGVPWVTVPEGQLGRTELSYRLRRRDFFQQMFRIRDAFNHTASVRQVFYLGAPERYVSLGYRFDREDPVRAGAASNQFAYDGNEVNAGFGWMFPAAVSTEIEYAFRHERYAPPSHGRHDETHQVILLARKSLTDYLDVSCAYLGAMNNSNDGRFDYERHIGSLTVEVRY